MNSRNFLENFANIASLDKSATFYITVSNMVFFGQITIEGEEGLEMAKILYDFIQANAHLFTAPVFEAAQRLFEEIQKAEVSTHVERVI
jgi:hypothetical protein